MRLLLLTILINTTHNLCSQKPFLTMGNKTVNGSVAGLKFTVKSNNLFIVNSFPVSNLEIINYNFKTIQVLNKINIPANNFQIWDINYSKNQFYISIDEFSKKDIPSSRILIFDNCFKNVKKYKVTEKDSNGSQTLNIFNYQENLAIIPRFNKFSIFYLLSDTFITDSSKLNGEIDDISINMSQINFFGSTYRYWDPNPIGLWIRPYMARYNTLLKTTKEFTYNPNSENYLAMSKIGNQNNDELFSIVTKRRWDNDRNYLGTSNYLGRIIKDSLVISEDTIKFVKKNIVWRKCFNNFRNNNVCLGMYIPKNEFSGPVLCYEFDKDFNIISQKDFGACEDFNLLPFNDSMYVLAILKSYITINNEVAYITSYFWLNKNFEFTDNYSPTATKFCDTFSTITYNYDSIPARFFTYNPNAQNKYFEIKGIDIFPNPSNSVLNISSYKPIQKISIYNATGNMMAYKKLNSAGTKIDVRNFSSGLYFIHLNFENKTVIKKFLIE